jgi:heavy metal translocating P-type ATPase
MKRIIEFLRHYKLFSIAVLAVIAGIVLQLTGQHTALKWTLGSVALVETVPLLTGMVQDIRSGSYGIDILAATAIVASVILVQDWAAIVIVLMLTGGESLEDYAEHRAQSELSTLLDRAPQKAHIIRNKKTLDVAVAAVKLGDVLVIRPGELVPVDATISEGSGSFDESSLTGESLPVVKEIGGTILSGSINIDGAITAKARATAEDSQYQQIIKLVRSASESKAPFVRLADRYSVPFTLMAFSIAGAVWVISGHAIRFLEVIVVATPCPLLLAAPIALISGMSRASKHGIIVKNGSALERLAEAETFAFDKTGTLTEGNLSVTNIRLFNDYSETEVLTLAAGLEQASNHVVGAAIVRAAHTQQLKLAKPKHVQEIAGSGLRASIKGREILVGRLGLLQNHAVSLPRSFKQTTQKLTATYVAIDGQLAGIISLTDELRSDAKGTIDYLRKRGISNILMITGDNEATARSIATELGIETVHGEMLPADKLRIIEGITDRPVVFVGDGVNDAPVLTVADVGIALGARGSTAASESADMVIMLDDIGRVANAVAIAKRTFSIARQSILVGIGLSIILMLIFATGKFPPLLGAVLQEGVDVVVIFNALRAHTGNLQLNALD